MPIKPPVTGIYPRKKKFLPLVAILTAGRTSLIMRKIFGQVINMKIQGAVIIEQGVTFAIVVVNRTVTNYTTRAIRVRNQLSQFFRNMPIILMSLDSNGTPHYYGRKDIVRFLQSIRLDQIPWKEYHIY